MGDQKVTACWMLAAAMSYGCTTDVCACSFPLPTAMIYGVVQTVDGAAVDGAAVEAYSGEGTGCESIGSELSAHFTAMGGQIYGSLLAQREQEDICIHVYARPPRGAAALDGSDTTMVVLDFRAGDPQDSARVVLLVLPK